MAKPVFHPALDDIPDDIDAMRLAAASRGVPVEEFCACMINAIAALLVRCGSSSQAMSATMEKAYASHVKQ